LAARVRAESGVKSAVCYLLDGALLNPRFPWRLSLPVAAKQHSLLSLSTSPATFPSFSRFNAAGWRNGDSTDAYSWAWATAGSYYVHRVRSLAAALLY